jgi:hypothetical protein
MDLHKVKEYGLPGYKISPLFKWYKSEMTYCNL